MKTKLYIVTDSFDLAMADASERLENGELIAFPTDTVYGFGAALFNEEAIERLYKAKRRPRNNPLTAYIPDAAGAESLALNIPKEYYALAERFLPGPLSIILNRKENVPSVVASGLGTIAIRVPDNRFALGLLKMFGRPVAGSSANISGEAPAVEGAAIMASFNGVISAVYDDGERRLRTESTVVSLAGAAPVVIREGFISGEELEDVLKIKL